jgi:hypothetical protein
VRGRERRENTCWGFLNGPWADSGTGLEGCPEALFYFCFVFSFSIFVFLFEIIFKPYFLFKHDSNLFREMPVQRLLKV